VKIQAITWYLQIKKFKYPQVMKSSLAIDYKLPSDFILSLEGNYSKEINAVYFQNVNLPSTGITLAGSDPRIRYDSSRIYGGHPTATVTNPNISSAILMKNASKGYSYFVTFQIQKTIRNLYMSAAYTYSKSKKHQRWWLNCSKYVERPLCNRRPEHS